MTVYQVGFETKNRWVLTFAVFANLQDANDFVARENAVEHYTYGFMNDIPYKYGVDKYGINTAIFQIEVKGEVPTE